MVKYFFPNIQPSEPDLVELQKRREAHRKMLARKRAKDELETETLAPQIIDSRFRVDMQTGSALERHFCEAPCVLVYMLFIMNS